MLILYLVSDIISVINSQIDTEKQQQNK